MKHENGNNFILVHVTYILLSSGRSAFNDKHVDIGSYLRVFVYIKGRLTVL